MENKNGSGIFLGVVSVATLVVAIIGATFAFFTAQATPGAGSSDIAGGTYNDLASALSLTVTKVEFTGIATGVSNLLVPTNIVPNNDGLSQAVKDKCVANGYTGCHVYKIDASSTVLVNNANIYFSNFESTANAATDWKYALVSGTVDPAGGNGNSATLVTVPSGQSATGSAVATGGTFARVDMHNNASLNSDGVTYYLIVYLANQDYSQNQNNDTSKIATGNYSGSVTMEAAGGQVVATFSNQQVSAGN